MTVTQATGQPGRWPRLALGRAALGLCALGLRAGAGPGRRARAAALRHRGPAAGCRACRLCAQTTGMAVLVASRVTAGRRGGGAGLVRAARRAEPFAGGHRPAGALPSATAFTLVEPAARPSGPDGDRPATVPLAYAGVLQRNRHARAVSVARRGVRPVPGRVAALDRPQRRRGPRRALAGTGDARRDAALTGLMTGLVMDAPPPAGLPQPVLIRLAPRADAPRTAGTRLGRLIPVSRRPPACASCSPNTRIPQAPAHPAGLGRPGQRSHAGNLAARREHARCRAGGVSGGLSVQDRGQRRRRPAPWQRAPALHGRTGGAVRAGRRGGGTRPRGRGRQQLAALEAALAELPRRRQAIVIAARVDEVPHREIAERFGISVRTVEKELRAGLEHCCRKLEKSMSNASVPGPANRLRDMAAMFTARISSSRAARPRPGCGWRPGRPQRPMARRSGSGADKASSMRAPSRRPAPPGRRCSRCPRARAPSRWARASQGAGRAPSWGRTGLRRLSGVPAAAGPVAGGERAGRRLSQRRRRTAGGGAGEDATVQMNTRTRINVSAQARANGGPAGWRGRAARRRAAGQPVGGRRQRDGARRLRQRALHGRPGARDLPGGVARVRGRAASWRWPRHRCCWARTAWARATPIWPPSAVGGAACWSSTTPLAQVVDEINRYRAGRILLMGDRLAGSRVQARFPLDQLADAALLIRDVYGAGDDAAGRHRAAE